MSKTPLEHRQFDDEIRNEIKITIVCRDKASGHLAVLLADLGEKVGQLNEQIDRDYPFATDPDFVDMTVVCRQSTNRITHVGPIEAF